MLRRLLRVDISHRRHRKTQSQPRSTSLSASPAHALSQPSTPIRCRSRILAQRAAAEARFIDRRRPTLRIADVSSTVSPILNLCGIQRNPHSPSSATISCTRSTIRRRTALSIRVNALMSLIGDLAADVIETPRIAGLDVITFTGSATPSSRRSACRGWQCERQPPRRAELPTPAFAHRALRHRSAAARRIL